MRLLAQNQQVLTRNGVLTVNPVALVGLERQVVLQDPAQPLRNLPQ